MTKRLNHEKPSWIDSDAIYFITICAKIRGENQFCHLTIAPIILESIAWRHEKQIWHCTLAVLMPDHIHFLISFPPQVTFTKAIRDWKNWLGRKHGLSWQDDFFDHRLRHDESLSEKADYILHNPVRAGLVDKSEHWPFIWRSIE